MHGVYGTTAVDIDGSNIVGYFHDGSYHGFSYDGATYTTLDVPGAYGTTAPGKGRAPHAAGCAPPDPNSTSVRGTPLRRWLHAASR
jgi:hypothetical protein